MQEAIAAQKAAEEAALAAQQQQNSGSTASGGDSTSSGGGSASSDGSISYPTGGGGVAGFDPIWPLPGVTYISAGYNAIPATRAWISPAPTAPLWWPLRMAR